MYHSITIGDKNTWRDFGLISRKKMAVNPPKPKYTYINAYGIDGGLDLSTAVAGRIVHDNRQGTWEFMTANRDTDWSSHYHEILNSIHGKYQRVILEDERQFYYKGRVAVKSWENVSRQFSKVVLEYYLEPYKYEINSANEPWLWDPFSFETGVIRNYGCASADAVSGIIEPLTVNGTLEFDVEATGRPYPIIFHVETGTDIAVEIARSGTAHHLDIGTTDFTELSGFAFEKKTHLKFTGHGTFWVEFRGGWL